MRVGGSLSGTSLGAVVSVHCVLVPPETQLQSCSLGLILATHLVTLIELLLRPPRICPPGPHVSVDRLLDTRKHSFKE